MSNYDAVHFNQADKGTRFINYIIDIIIYNLLTILFFALLGFVLTIIGNYSMVNSIANMNPILDRIVTAIFTSLFWFLTEWLTKGRTIDKYATGTIVVTEDGYIPDVNTLLKRNFSRIIPFDALSFLGNRGWHDSISNTYVVKKKAFEQDVFTNSSLNEIGKDIEN